MILELTQALRTRLQGKVSLKWRADQGAQHPLRRTVYHVHVNDNYITRIPRADIDDLIKAAQGCHSPMSRVAGVVARLIQSELPGFDPNTDFEPEINHSAVEITQRILNNSSKGADEPLNGLEGFLSDVSLGASERFAQRCAELRSMSGVTVQVPTTSEFLFTVEQPEGGWHYACATTSTIAVPLDERTSQVDTYMLSDWSPQAKRAYTNDVGDAAYETLFDEVSALRTQGHVYVAPYSGPQLRALQGRLAWTYRAALHVS